MTTLTALSNLDSSRLPCGVLEEFVLSPDRNAMLRPSKSGDATDKKNTERESSSSSSETKIKKTFLVDGSDEYIYYSLLQLSNAITHSNPGSQLDKLIAEFEHICTGLRNKQNEDESYEIPNNIMTLILRHQTWMFPKYSQSSKAEFLHNLRDDLGVNTEHEKPSGANVLDDETNNNEEVQEPLLSKLTRPIFEDLLVTTSLQRLSEGYNTHRVSQNFKPESIEFLTTNELFSITHAMRVDMMKEWSLALLHFPDFMQWVYDSSPKSKEEEAGKPSGNALLSMFGRGDRDSERTTHTFGSLSVHQYLTIEQLDFLGSANPYLWTVNQFVQTYIKKLTPITMIKYENMEWSRIPKREQKNFLDVLYKWANEQLTKPVQRSLKSAILYAYVDFYREEGIYQFEAFLEYLNIPKRNKFNSKLVSAFEKNSRKTWADGEPATFGGSYTFFNGYRNIPRWTQSSDEKLIKQFLMVLFSDEATWQKLLQTKMTHKFASKFVRNNNKKSVRQAFGSLIDDEELEIWEAEGYLYSGQVSNAASYIEKLIKLQNQSYVDDLKNAVELEFLDSNATYEDMKSPTEIQVRAKNTGEILCKVFEINTKSYFRDKQEDLKTDMELDGFHAAHEWTINPKANNTFHRSIVKVIFPEHLQKKRGVFFIDLVANGQHSRAIIRRGDIRVLEHITANGHRFQLLDEDGELIKDGCIWMSGHIYHSDQKGEIDIPFSTEPKQQKIILQRNDDPEFNVLSSFDHKSENYELQCGIYLDREQIIAKKMATVIVRPGILINNYRTTVKILQNVKLSIEVNTSDSRGVNKTFNNFKLADNEESFAKISVPMNTTGMVIRLSCQVMNESQNKLVDLEKTQAFYVNAIHQSDQIESFHLIPQSNHSFIIALYGKTGEGIPRATCKLQLTHRFIKETLEIKAITDELGRIYLPNMDGFTHLQVSHLKANGKWNLEDNLSINDIVNELNMIEDSVVSIPFVPPRGNEVKLLLFDGLYARQYPKNIKYDKNHKEIVLEKLKAGIYNIVIFGLSKTIKIKVIQGKVLENNFAVNEDEMLELSKPKQLQICEITGDRNNGVKIVLDGVNKNTRVHVLMTHFMPEFGMNDLLNRISSSNVTSAFLSHMSNVYMKQRTIGEEYRYVLEREKEPQFLGNSLQRPTLLIKPLEHKSTKTGTRNARAGDTIQQQSLGSGRAFVPTVPSSRSGAIQRGNMTDFKCLDFLATEATVLCNLKPDAHGVVKIDASHIHSNHALVRCVGADEERVVMSSYTLPFDSHKMAKKEKNEKKSESTETEPIFEYRDLKLYPGLNPAKVFTEERDIELLNAKGRSYKVIDFKSSEVVTFDSIGDVFNYYTSLSSSNSVDLKKNWSFLYEWHNLGEAKQLHYVEEYFSHELNLFLSKKDPEFFNRVCKPLIQSKLRKDIVDWYLLGNDQELEKYTDMDYFEQMNSLEKILVAHATKKQDFREIVKKYFNGFWLRGEEDLKKLEELFTTAIKCKQMQQESEKEKSPKRGSEDKKVSALENEAESDRDDEDDFDGNEKSLDRSFGGAMGGLYAGGGGMESAALQMTPKKHKKKKKSGSRGRGAKWESESRSIVQKRERAGDNQLFKQLDQTKEYCETYYYKVTYENLTHTLVPMNKFWCSYAEHLLNEDKEKRESAFLSKHWLLPTTSLNEILLALAIMDLPLSADGPMMRESEDRRDPAVTLVANEPCIVLVKQLKEITSTNTSLVSINASFFDPDDTHIRDEDGEKQDKIIEIFTPGKVYGMRAVVTNLSSTAMSVELLVEIPQGSIPVSGGFYTKTTFLQLNPFSTTHQSFYFYWPSPGKFGIFPTCVSRKGKPMGTANVPKELEVSYPQKDKKLDVKSWKDVYLNGKDSDVLAFLEKNNPYELDMSEIYHRCKDIQFFQSICKVLRSCGCYDPEIWGYATIHHNCLKELCEYLIQNSYFVDKILKPVFKSTWINYDAVENHGIAHLEYIPLVNARAHLLGQQREILNDAFKQQYEKVLYRIAFSSTSVRDIPTADQLSLLYYLLLQERIQEGIEVFSLLNKKECAQETEILFDYLQAYMALFNENEQEAGKVALTVANKYRRAQLPKRLNRLFEDIEVLLSGEMDDYQREEEQKIEGTGNVFGLGDRDRAMENLSKTTPSMEWNVDSANRTIRISYQVLQEVTVNFYVLNTEILFSQDPFFSQKENEENYDNKQSAFSYIAPNHTMRVKLNEEKEKEKGTTIKEKDIEIPLSLKNQNLFIQIMGDTLTVSKAFYDNQLLLQVKENYGQLKVLNKNTGKPVKKAYVKVYAKTDKGSEFYKDGYTDLRGKFDYISISTDQLSRTSQLAILVATENLGCVVRQVNKPKS